jgi:hypothetical protein
MYDPYHPAERVNARATDLWNQFPIIVMTLVLPTGMIILIRYATKGHR